MEASNGDLKQAQTDLSRELDVNAMKKHLVHMFCAKLDGLDVQAATLVRLQSACLESLRELASRTPQVAERAITEQEQRMLDFHRGLK